MSKNWSKIVLVSVMMLLVASASYATTARVNTLAGTGDYTSDDSNAHRWYSVLPMYADQVNAELGHWNSSDWFDSRAMSLNYACGEEGKWGTYRVSLNENQLDHPGLWMANSFFSMLLTGNAGNTGFGFVATPMNKWDFAGGWEIGENFMVGASITRSSWNFESSDPDTTADQSYTTFGVGGTWSNNEDMSFDAAFTYGTAGGEASFGATDPYTVEWDSKSAFEIAGRFFWDWKDNVTVVPCLNFQSAEYSLEDNDDPTTLGGPMTGDKWTNFVFGVGLNIDVNTDNLLIFVAEVTNMKWEPSNGPDDTSFDDDIAEVKGTYLPTIRMALETKVNSFMTTRVGAAKHLGDYTFTDVEGDEVIFEPGAEDFFSWPGSDPQPSSFEWTLGVGFNVAEWTIDLEVEDDAPFSTFYWITGYSAYDEGFSARGPVSRISAIYNF